MKRGQTRRHQRGAALLLFGATLVLGVVWYTVSAVGKVSPSTTEREAKTRLALKSAKEVLLGYAAQYAARTSGAGADEPGQMPCPESSNAIGTTNEGQAATSCSNVNPSVGRLPWRTLGNDQLRDGDGEPLWYVLSGGFRAAPMNFSTPGQLAYDGAANAAVALIIAPGKPLNTLADPATPPAGCAKVNQLVATRNTAPLSAANFLECGNATGSYTSAGVAPWNNDRVIAITAGEWADAIAPAISDRLQRQVAPALESWRQTESFNNWGYPFLPHASSFTNPASNDLCGDTAGDSGVTEGLMPTARAASSNCTWWGSPLVQKSRGGGNVSGSCTTNATAIVCTVNYTSSPRVRVTVTARNIWASFRGHISTANARASAGTKVSFQTGLYLNIQGGIAFADVQFDMPSGGSPVTITIDHLPDAALFSDTRMRWFLDNNWDRHVYYAISPAARALPLGTVCNAAGDPACLAVNDLPAANGNPNDKRLMLVLSGRALAGKTQPSANLPDYLELENAITGNSLFIRSKITSSFNDRLAMCPFRYHSTATPACN